jgi:hypothetical protein
LYKFWFYASLVFYLGFSYGHILEPRVKQDVLWLNVDGGLAHATVAQAPVGVDQGVDVIKLFWSVIYGFS